MESISVNEMGKNYSNQTIEWNDFQLHKIIQAEERFTTFTITSQVDAQPRFIPYTLLRVNVLQPSPTEAVGKKMNKHLCTITW